MAEHMSPALARVSQSLERIAIEVRGPHLIATLDHPPTKNALTDQLMRELNELLDATADDTAIRSLVLRGANGVFCAGADLKAALAHLDKPPGDTDPVALMNRSVGELYARLNSYPKAVVAVVEGPAFGGGFGMVCCADMVIVGDDALFALSETSLGLPPGQIAPFVVGRIGQSAARRLALSGLRVDAVEAVRIGLADQHCDAQTIEAELTRLLNMIARCAPRANAVTKQLIQHSSPSIQLAADAFASCLRDEEGREGVSAFAQKRPAAWVEKL